MFLHLTPATAETGATEVMNREDTMAYHGAGYFGQYRSEFKADLESFAKEHGLPYQPLHFDATPGDVTFLNMNFLHRAVAPRTGHRDIVSFCFLPNILPWEEQLEIDGIDSITIAGGIQKDPHPKKAVAQQPVGSVM